MEFKDKIYSNLFKKIALMLIFITTFTTAFSLNKKPKTLKDIFNKSAISQKSTTRTKYHHLAKKPLIIPSPLKTTKTSKHCAKNSNIHALKKETPQIAQDFNILSQLTLTGQSIYRYLKNPINNITSCTESFDKLKLGGVYTPYLKEIEVAQISDTKTFFHEAFHAYQSSKNRDSSYRILNRKDAVFAVLAQEATSIAYELITEQEAKNKGLRLISNRSKHIKLIGDSDDSFLKKLFHRTYIDTMYQHNKIKPIKNTPKEYKLIRFNNGDEIYVKDNIYSDKPLFINDKDSDILTKLKINLKPSIEENALQAAGRAVVDYLLSAKNNSWAKFYIKEAIQNTQASYYSIYIKPDYVENRSYIKHREYIYNNIGRVSPNINLTPKKYLGINANVNIHKSLIKIYKYREVKKTVSKKMPKKLG